jgi:hypothetical protein
MGQHPGFGVIDQADESTQDSIVGGIECAPLLAGHVLAADGEFDPNLGLGDLAFRLIELVDKSCLIAPPSPICAQTDREARRIWSVNE